MIDICEQKQRLYIALEKLELLVGGIGNGSKIHKSLQDRNAILEEENRLARERIVEQDKNIESLRSKNKTALEEVQNIISKIERMKD